MKFRRMKLSLIMTLAMASILMSACGSMELGIMPPEAAVAGLGIPDDVIVAREVALAHLRETYPEAALPAGMQWQGDYVEQGAEQDSGAYQFTSGTWVIDITYPLVAPESTVYTIELFNSASDFRWEGMVDARGEVSEIEAAQDVVQVTAWLGHIASLPEGYAGGAAFQLSPDGAGEFEITAAGEEAAASIAEVKDGEGVEEFVHVWGTLSCGVDAYNGCRLAAERVRYGNEVIESEPVEAWEGVIYERTLPPGSGGDDFFVLTGDYPVEYGIWAQEEGLNQELERLRDTGTIIRVWGQLAVGVPDWAGTQIRVERYEELESSSLQVPAEPTRAPDDRNWQTYVNDRYGYEIQFPAEATLEEMGIHGYPSDELGNPVGDIPQDLEPGDVFEYLQATYGENLCVQITYSLGYLTISVPENEGFRYATCGRTGVGVGDLNPKEETVLIDGSEGQAQGYEFQSGGENLVQHNETLVLTLGNGTRIEYGSRPVDDATYQDYLMKTKPVLLEILSTYLSR